MGRGRRLKTAIDIHTLHFYFIYEHDTLANHLHIFLVRFFRSGGECPVEEKTGEKNRTLINITAEKNGCPVFFLFFLFYGCPVFSCFFLPSFISVYFSLYCFSPAYPDG